MGSSVSGVAAAAQTAAATQTKLAASSTQAAVAGGALDEVMRNEFAASTALNQALNGVFIETEKVAGAQAQAAAATNENTIAQTRSLGQLTRGAGASGLSLLGLRGATLAASASFLAGTAAVVGFSKAVQSAASLQTELNVFRATAGATADEMARVSDEAKQLGRDLTLPGVTAQTAAVAMTELAKAGLSVQDSIAGARGALQLSTAAQIDVATATNLVAGALNSFQLSGRDAVKVADLLTGAAKESQGEISDMGTALAQASAVSRQFGVRIEDTVTLLTELAKAGVSGGRAGTSLRVAFLRLVNPTAGAAKALKELNLQGDIYNNQGHLNIHIFTDIQKALKGYTAEERNATLATIFGSDAIRAAGIIGADGAKNYLTLRDAVTEAGLAQQLAGARTQGLQGDIENLKNQFSALGLTVGQVSSGPVSLFVSEFAGLASKINTVADGLIVLGEKTKDVGKKASESDPALGFFQKHLSDIAKLPILLNPVGQALTVADLALRKFGVDASNNNLKVFSGDVATATDALLGFQSALFGVAAIQRDQPGGGQGGGGFNVARIQNIIQGFDDRTLRDRIAKNNEKLLTDLKAEQDFLISELQKKGVQNRPALRRALEAALAGVGNDIDAILGKQAADAKSAKDKAIQIAKDRAAAAATLAASKLALINATLDARLSAAQLTKGIGDDKNILNLQIKAAQDDLNKNKKIAANQKLSAQVRVDAAIKVQNDVIKINGIKQQIKSLTGADGQGGGGFSLSDLFREGVQNFASFGSNIASRNGVLSGQDARAQLGSNIAQIAGAQLTEAQRQTALLESIDANTGGGAGASGGGKTARRNVRGNAISTFDSAALAAINGYG